MIEALLGPDPTVTATVLILVLARTLPLAFLAPWLGWRGTAAYVRVAVALVLAMAMTPLAQAGLAAPPSGAVVLGLAIVREVLVGAAFAIAVSAPL